MTDRYRFISEHHATYGVTRLCRVLAASRRQDYYEWLAAQPAQQEREQALVEQIRRAGLEAGAQRAGKF
jgi:hypothetical protein